MSHTPTGHWRLTRLTSPNGKSKQQRHGIIERRDGIRGLRYQSTRYVQQYTPDEFFPGGNVLLDHPQPAFDRVPSRDRVAVSGEIDLLKRRRKRKTHHVRK